jgi:hypothetical protein
MLDVSSIILSCSNFIFHLSFLNCNLFFLFACRNFLWMKKLICRLVTYLKQSITFGYNNLARGVLAFWLQRSVCSNIQVVFIVLCLFTRRCIWDRSGQE